MEKKLWILLLLLVALAWDIKMNDASVSAVLIMAFWLGVFVPLPIAAVVCVFMWAVPRKNISIGLTFLGAFAGWCLSWYMNMHVDHWGNWLGQVGNFVLGYLFLPPICPFVGALGVAIATAKPIPKHNAP